MSVTGETAGAAGATGGQSVVLDNKANYGPIDAGVLSVGGGRRRKWK